MALPALIVVSGPAGSGKTQLAHALAAAIGCPAICRDEIKEGMVHAYGADFRAAPGDPLTKRTFPLFFEVLRVLVAGGVTVVAEAAFQHNNWQQGLTPLLPLARLRIVHCTVDDTVARERVALRRTNRTRAAHADAEWLAESAQRPGAFERIRLAAPTISVDTTDGYVPDLAAIVEFASRP